MDMWEYAKKLKNLRRKYVCPWKIETLKKTEKCMCFYHKVYVNYRDMTTR